MIQVLGINFENNYIHIVLHRNQQFHWLDNHHHWSSMDVFGLGGHQPSHTQLWTHWPMLCEWSSHAHSESWIPTDGDDQQGNILIMVKLGNYHLPEFDSKILWSSPRVRNIFSSCGYTHRSHKVRFQSSSSGLLPFGWDSDSWTA